MRKLNKEVLIELGYESETWQDDDNEDVVTWYKNGITLFEDQWSREPSYNFAGRTREDGSFKSGWLIKTDEQLKMLENVLSGDV
jgi:hypothetical protein